MDAFQAAHTPSSFSPDVDLTSDRAEHVASMPHSYAALLGHAIWWGHDGESYATTNVVATPPTVTHFKAPLAGGPVEVMHLDGSYVPAPRGMFVGPFRYVGTVVTDETEGQFSEYMTSAIYYQW